MFEPPPQPRPSPPFFLLLVQVVQIPETKLSPKMRIYQCNKSTVPRNLKASTRDSKAQADTAPSAGTAKAYALSLNAFPDPPPSLTTAADADLAAIIATMRLQAPMVPHTYCRSELFVLAFLHCTVSACAFLCSVDLCDYVH